MKIIDQIPQVKYFIIWKDSVPEDLPAAMKGKVLTWSELLFIG